MSEAPGPEDHFAANLRTLRESREMSQDDLAATMSEQGFPFHQTTVYKIETGARRVQLTEALALARILGVPVEQMSEPPGSHLTVIGDLRRLIKSIAELRHRNLEPAAYEYRQASDKLRELLDSGRDPDDGRIVDIRAWQALERAKRTLTAVESKELEFVTTQSPIWRSDSGHTTVMGDVPF